MRGVEVKKLSHGRCGIGMTSQYLLTPSRMYLISEMLNRKLKKLFPTWFVASFMNLISPPFVNFQLIAPGGPEGCIKLFVWRCNISPYSCKKHEQQIAGNHVYLQIFHARSFRIHSTGRSIVVILHGVVSFVPFTSWTRYDIQLSIDAFQ